ncbi:MAG: methionine gamma-lyase family protein [Clostridia bacterium]|nr:methionine gamma-lyase family protein [Clostridia bacterium]
MICERIILKMYIDKLVKEVEEDIKEQISDIDIRCMKNSMRVLDAFQKNRIADVHFNSTTGYGYDDIGRDTIEKVFADIFHTEDALVRNQFISGTHAITVALFANLRPGDTLLSISGKPYDTLDSIIGFNDNKSSLKSYGIKYEQIDLIEDNFDIEKIRERLAVKDVKMVEIQRSRGYATRKSLTMDKIQRAIEVVREVNDEVIIMVDNCYGEFVDEIEPVDVGADFMVGSLIKNLGGGLAPNGAYIVGKKDIIELCAERLTAPGQGKEVGPSLGINKSILQGIYMAPSVVASSLKTAVFTARLLEKLGFNPIPKFDERRSDIVQTIIFGDEEKLIRYVQGIQMGSAIDSESIPMPWDMPGYTDKVIMASGSFTQGSSIELSCDAPIRAPFIAFQQGSLTYEYGKIGVIKAVKNLMEK